MSAALPGSARWHSEQVLKWLEDGGSSWGVPDQSIAYCAKRAAGLSHREASK